MTSKKATKVPMMKKDQPFADWKKELQIWRKTNTKLGVDPEIQAGVLFESLEGTPRQTVLSELTVDQITHADGVENVIEALEEFFEGNEIINAFNAHDDLNRFRRKPDVDMESFLVDFQLKVNKVKASGTTLPDGVIGYTLLKCANLPQDKMDVCKATCDTLTYKNVRKQLEKMGLGKQSSSSSNKFSTVNADAGSSKVKVEDCFYSDLPRQRYYESSEGSSSEDDLNGGKHVYFSGKWPHKSCKENSYVQHPYKRDNKYESKYKLNPVDKFGHVTDCSFCKCIYHWLVDCPYAPEDIKRDILSKSKRTKHQYQKPL